MAKSSPEGELIFDQEVKSGYMHDVSLNAKFAAKASVETGGLASLAGGKFSGELSTEITGGYNFSFTSTTKVKKYLKMPAGSPGYVYQLNSVGTTTSGKNLEWCGAVIMTKIPLEIHESKKLVDASKIYWLDDTAMMKGRGDDGNVSFNGWTDCLKKAKNNLKPGMGAVAVWSGNRGTLYIKNKIPAMSRHASMETGAKGCTTFWLAPALSDLSGTAKSDTI